MHVGLGGGRGAVRARAKRGSRVIRSFSSGRNLQSALGKDNEKGEGGDQLLCTNQTPVRYDAPAEPPPPQPPKI